MQFEKTRHDPLIRPTTAWLDSLSLKYETHKHPLDCAKALDIVNISEYFPDWC